MPKRWLWFVLILGCYLTLRGYHSREVDQAFRLPLLLHRQAPNLYANDPFVRAFDVFNPHLGYLTLLDSLSRGIGLSLTLFSLFLATFGLTCLGVDRLARRVWPSASSNVGLVAVVLLLTARAGNIGTNHLFDGELLDRLLALSLVWVGLAETIDRPERGGRTSILIGLAALVHPSIGLQVGMLLGSSWCLWWLVSRGRAPSTRTLAANLASLAFCLVPSVVMMATQTRHLLEGLPQDEIWHLSVEIQSPQHMLPRLWRLPQWLAWGSYFVLAGLAVTNGISTGLRQTSGAGLNDEHAAGGTDSARTRLLLTLGLILVGLGIAAVGIEGVRHLRLTMFQPFRMATLARGLALVLAADRILRLWENHGLAGKVRAGTLVVGLAGDWMFVVAVAVEVVATVAEGLAAWLGRWSKHAMVPPMAALIVGLIFLNRHDTEQGEWALIAVTLGVPAWVGLSRVARLDWNRRRLSIAFSSAWVLPLAALVLPPILGVESGNRLVVSISERCRIWPVPLDEVERLAVWARDHTPADATFIGPPGPKAFRLWSLRSVAFNRASSPYHALGLADWSRRFKDHVGFEGPTSDFAAAYLKNRQQLEARYSQQAEQALADLARRQGAGFILAGSGLGTSGAIVPIKTDGRFALYRLANVPVVGLREAKGRER